MANPQVAQLLPLLKHSDPVTLPAAPLRLLQDLTHVFGPKKTYPLPNPVAVADASPLPLSFSVLVYLGILRADMGVLGEWDGKANVFSPPDSKEDPTELKIAYVGTKRFEELEKASVQACSAIRERARSQGKEMTFLDVARVVSGVDIGLDGRGLGVRVVVKE